MEKEWGVFSSTFEAVGMSLLLSPNRAAQPEMPLAEADSQREECWQFAAFGQCSFSNCTKTHGTPRRLWDTVADEDGYCLLESKNGTRGCTRKYCPLKHKRDDDKQDKDQPNKLPKVCMPDPVKPAIIVATTKPSTKLSWKEKAANQRGRIMLCVRER